MAISICLCYLFLFALLKKEQWVIMRTVTFLRRTLLV